MSAYGSATIFRVQKNDKSITHASASLDFGVAYHHRFDKQCSDPHPVLRNSRHQHRILACPGCRTRTPALVVRHLAESGPACSFLSWFRTCRVFLGLHFTYWAWALQNTTLANAMLFIGLQPLLAPFVARPLLGERLDRWEKLACLLACLGMIDPGEASDLCSGTAFRLSCGIAVGLPVCVLFRADTKIQDQSACIAFQPACLCNRCRSAGRCRIHL